VTTTGDSITGDTKTPVKESTSSTSAKHFTTQRPSFASDGLETLLEQHGVTINAKPANPPPPLWLTLLLSFGPTLLIVIAVVYLIRRAASAGGTGGLLGAFGQSRARLYDPERPGTTFADVAGIDEV
jgi:cell division protease FtsH